MGHFLNILLNISLTSLFIQSNQLCVPNTTGFQDWLDSITNLNWDEAFCIREIIFRNVRRDDFDIVRAPFGEGVTDLIPAKIAADGSSVTEIAISIESFGRGHICGPYP